MSIVVEILKAGQLQANSILVKGKAKITLAPGDILKMPDADVQTLRKGNDLILIVIDEQGGTSDQIVLPGFFGPDGLGLVQIGPDGGGIITPASDLGRTQSNFELGSREEADDLRQTDEGIGSAGALIAELSSSDSALGVFSTDMNQGSSGEQESPVLGAIYAEINPSVLADMIRPENFKLEDFSNVAEGTLALYAAPAIAAQSAGGWINRSHLQSDSYTISGQGVDGLLVEVALRGAGGTTIVRRIKIAEGSWQIRLDAADIQALGEGAVSVRASHVSSAGQVISKYASLDLAVDTVPPSVPTVLYSAAISDGVVTATEMVSGALSVSGTADANIRVVVTLLDSLGHSNEVSATANANGVWELSLSSGFDGLVDGLLSIQVRSTDVAGNIASAAPLAVNLRQGSPLPPHDLRLTSETDTAIRDNITANTSPTIEGVTEAGYTVRVYRDINKDGVAHELEYVDTVATDGNGRFTYTAQSLAEGRHQYLFKTVDEVGNISVDVAAASFVVDTIVFRPEMSSISEDDRISYDEVLALTVPVSGTGEVGATIHLTLSAGATFINYEVVVQSNGEWSIPVFSNVASDADRVKSWRYGFGDNFNGNVVVEAYQVDVAGNISSIDSRSVYLRTEPVPDIASLRFADGQDTGRSASDGITKLQTFTIEGDGPANMLVRVYIDTNLNGTIDLTGNTDTQIGEFMIDINGHFTGAVTLPGEGQFKLLAVAYDQSSGSMGALIDLAESLQVTVDKTIGNVTFDTVAGNDVINFVDIVDDGVIVTGKGEPGALVNLVLKAGSIEDSSYAGIPVDANGNWSTKISSITIQVFGNGLITMTATQVDVAGNASVLVDSNVKQFEIRLGTLEAPLYLSLAAADDSGSSSSDSITQNTSNLTISGTSITGYTVTIFRDINLDGGFDAGEFLAQAPVNSDGTFSIDVNLPEGAHYLRAFAEDSYGQTSGVSLAKLVTVDTSIALVSDIAATSDNVFNGSEVATGAAAISGSGERGSSLTLEFFDGGIAKFQKTGQVSLLDGRWTVSLSEAEVTALGEGQKSVRVKQQDPAGNESGWASLTFSVDTGAVGTSETESLALATAFNESPERAWRNGIEPGAITWGEIYSYLQGIPVANTLQVAVSLASGNVLGDSLRLVWGNKPLTHAVSQADLDRGYVLVDISGDVIAENRALQSIVNVTARYTDAAGNEGASFAVMSNVDASLNGQPPSLVPDTTTYATHDVATNTFYSRFSSASIFADEKNFKIYGRGVANETIKIFNDANLDNIVEDSEVLTQVNADELGNYSANLSLAPGAYTLRAIGNAVVGGVQPIPGTVNYLVVDVTPPVAPVLNNPGLVSGDGRVSATERDNGVVISGSADTYATLKLQLVNESTGIFGSIYSGITADAFGHWQSTVSVLQWGQLGDGVISIRLTQTDRAGNISAPFTVGGELPLVNFDTFAAPPTFFDVATDNYINAIEAASGVVVQGGGDPYANLVLVYTGTGGNRGPRTVQVNGDGFWQDVLLPEDILSLKNGQLQIAAYQTDLAGNLSAVARQVINIDTVVSVPSLNTVAGNNVINASEKALGVLLNGTAEAGATVDVTISKGGVSFIRSATASAGGNWELTLSSSDIDLLGGDGVVSLVVRQTDVAGNLSATLTRQVTVSAGPLSTPVVVDALTGDDSLSDAEQALGVTVTGSGPGDTQLTLVFEGVLGNLSRTLTIPADGNWTTTLSKDDLQSTIGVGDVILEAYAVNADQQSTGLTTHPFRIERAEPSASISRVGGDGYVNLLESQSTVAIGGGGEAGHVVELTITGQSGSPLLRTVGVGDDRKWSISLTPGEIAALGEGEVIVSTVQKVSTAPGALTSLATASSFIVDTLAPMAPNDSDISTAGAYNSTQSDMVGGVTVSEAADGVIISVPLAADAVAGNRMVVSWGGQEVTRVLAAAEVPEAGTRVINVLIPTSTIITAGSGIHDISVVYYDTAGNVSTSRILASQINVVAPPAPPQFQAIYTDGKINASEFAGISASGGRINGTVIGDGTVELTLVGEGGQTRTYAGLAVNGGAWFANFSAADLTALGEGRIEAQAVFTHITGAKSAQGRVFFDFDETLPLVPSAERMLLAAEENARGELAGGLIRTGNTTTEAAQAVIVNVAIGADVRNGDSLSLFWGGQQINSVVQQSDISRGYAQLSVSSYVMSLQGDSANLVVTAQVTDRAGNVGSLYSVWNGTVDAIPLSPDVASVAGDNFLNLAEATAGWAIAGLGSAGNTVKIVIEGSRLNGQNQKETWISPEIAIAENGTWYVNLTLAEATQLGSGPAKVTSFQYDQGGNVSDPGRNPSDPSIRNFEIDLTPPAAPTVDPVTADNRVSFVEAQSDVVLSGTGENRALVNVVLAHDGQTVLKTATVAGGVWSVTIAPSDFALLGGGAVPITATVTQSDVAGNTSAAATHDFKYSTDSVSVPLFSSVTGITHISDLYFNMADLAELGGQQFTVSGVGDVRGGYKVRLTLINGDGASFNFDPVSVTPGTGAWSRALTTAEFLALGQGAVKVTGVQISPELDESVVATFDTGNAEKTFFIDTVAPSLVNLTFSASGLSGNAKAGDRITALVQASEAIQIHSLNSENLPTILLDFGGGLTRPARFDAALSAAAGSDKLVFIYDVVSGDASSSISVISNSISMNGATLSDAAGNPALATVATVVPGTILVDTIAPTAPAIIGVDEAGLATVGGATVNRAETVAGIDIHVNLTGTGAKTGDTLEIGWLVGADTSLIRKQLSVSEILANQAIVTLELSVVGNLEGTANLNAKLRDAAGNYSPASANFAVVVDTIVPNAPTFNAWMSDNKINQTEWLGDLVTSLSGTSVESGATVNASLTQGTTTLTLPVSVDGTGGWSVTKATMLAALGSMQDGVFEVAVLQTDAAGNPSTVRTASYYMDRQKPLKPSILSVPAAEDGWVNLRDASVTGVQVTIGLTDTQALAGDKVILSGFKQDYIRVLTSADILANFVTFSLPAETVLQTTGDLPVTDGQLKARIEDRGGNVSDLSNSYLTKIDTIALPPLVDVTQGAAAGISKGQSISVVYFYGYGAEAGADINVYMTGVLGKSFLLPTTALANGSYSVRLSPVDMTDLGDGPVSYQVTQTDAALNTSVATVGGFALYLSVPPPTLLLMTADNVVDVSEAATVSTIYSGLGVAGSKVELDFFSKDVNGVYETSPRLRKSNIIVAGDGTWSVTLSSADFTAVSPTKQGPVQIRGKQTDLSDNTSSSYSYQEFYIDRLLPTLLTGTPTLFDANGDGANKDGLLITFAEPVAVVEMRKLTSFTLATGKTFGTDARVEAVDSTSINGAFYATQFKIFLDSDSNLTTNDKITIKKASIVDAGGNAATLVALDQIVTLPYLISPGLPTPPVDIMDDNRINAVESSNVTRLTFTSPETPTNLNAALGGLMEIKVDGNVIDRVIPKVNFLSMDLTLAKAAKLPQGAAASARVKVTLLDNSIQYITLYSSGDAATANTATTVHRFTSQQIVDLVNVKDIRYFDSNLSNFRQPTSTISHTSSGGVSNFNLKLDFPNTVHLAVGAKATATMYVVFTDINRWETITLTSVQTGTTSTATTGVTSLDYTYTVNRPTNTNAQFFWESYGGVTLDSAITVVTSGAGAPVISGGYNTSVVVPTSSLDGSDVLTTSLLDKDFNPIAGSSQSLSYSSINPNRVEFTQSLADALSAAGRKITLFVDGQAASTPVNMGISSLFLNVWMTWENQTGASTGWGAGANLQAADTVNATVRVTFKTGSGLAPRDVVLTATGNQILSSHPLQFYGSFPGDIDVTKVQGIAYLPGSITQVHPNQVFHSSVITTNQLVDLPTTAWDGLSDGLKQLTAQITTADGSLTSVFSAPKQIRLDTQVSGIDDIRIVTDTNSNGTLDAGDVIQLHFRENVQFTFSALPDSFGSNPLVTPIGSENGFSQSWQVKLGGGATIQPGQSFTMEAGKVFDVAGNNNASGLPVTATIPNGVMTAAAAPIIDNVSTDNVITSLAEATPVKVLLSKASAGDEVKLFIDGVQVAAAVVTSNGQADISFNVAGNLWGGDGERMLSTSLTRGGVTSASNLRSVYVAADQSHWSQEAAYANKIFWFDPDTLTQADGSTITTWAASAGGISVANTVANTKTIKMTDPYNGHTYLITDANSMFLETKVGGSYLYLAQAPTTSRFLNDATMPTAGYTDFMMFKPVVEGSQVVMRHPTYRFTANSTAVTYTPLAGGSPVTVQPYTSLLKAPYLQYTFSGLTSGVRSVDSPNTGTWWDTTMTNVISLGAWQMVTEAVKGYTMSFYNQMRFNQSVNQSNYIPNPNNPISSADYLLAFPSIDAAERRFRIGGSGLGVLGDQISVTVATNWAYQQEIGAYLAAKYQSAGAVVARNSGDQADAANRIYDLATSNVPGAIIDQILRLTDIASDDVITTAGADYVMAGSGNDLVKIRDLAFRYIDGGLGTDTLALDVNYIGRSDVVLSDYISNARGLSGSTTDNQRVNDAGFHRLMGFERLDFAQDGGTENLRQILTISAADVKQLSETTNLEMVLGRQDVLKTSGFSTLYGTAGVFSLNNEWYDHRYSVSEGSTTYNLYTRDGDRMPEAVSFKNIAAINQLQLSFDHSMIGNVLAGDFTVKTYSGPSLFASSAVSIDLRQGVSLTLSGALNAVSKITYTGAIKDEAGRGFLHNTWMLGTDGSDTLDGVILSASEKASGVTFLGGAGADRISGTSGADIIVGGLGTDILTGGTGSDTFLYKNELVGSGAAGGLGGTSGDVITDFSFSAVDSANNDRIDLSMLFEQNFKATGNAHTDAARLAAGQFIEILRKANTTTLKEDLQIWVDRDGGGALGILATIADGATNLPSQYPSAEPSQDLLERLIVEGRVVVSHY